MIMIDSDIARDRMNLIRYASARLPVPFHTARSERTGAVSAEEI